MPSTNKTYLLMMQRIIESVTEIRDEGRLRQQCHTLLCQQLNLMEVFAAASFAPLSTEVDV
jgi:hypothetical protein